MIPILDTPMERAASTTPGSVETRLCSTSLDDASVHMMTMGKVAAVLPMDVHAKDKAEQPADYKGDAYYTHSLAKRLQQGPVLYVSLKVAKIRCICSNHYAAR